MAGQEQIRPQRRDGEPDAKAASALIRMVPSGASERPAITWYSKEFRPASCFSCASMVAGSASSRTDSAIYVWSSRGVSQGASSAMGAG